MSDDTIWSQKGATPSDKSARQEFGLTQEEIIGAMRAGKLQYRECSMHGNPWYRLLRHEVESLVRDKSGPGHLTKKKLQKEALPQNEWVAGALGFISGANFSVPGACLPG